MDADKFASVVAAMQRAVPGLELRYKSQNTLQRVIGFFVRPFNADYSSSFATTLGRTIYLPSPAWCAEDWHRAAEVFLHECVHAWDASTMGTAKFYARWLTDKGRLQLEARGYALQLLVCGVLGSSTDPGWVVDELTGPAYLHAAASPAAALSALDEAHAELLGTPLLSAAMAALAV